MGFRTSLRPVQRTSQYCAFGKAYKGSPKKRNYTCRIKISIAMPRAVATLKSFLRPQPNVQARMTSLRSISGWHWNYFNARLNPFVFKKLPQLIESPRVRAAALGLLSRLFVRSIADTCQVFNSDSGITAQSISNDSSTNSMVQPSLIPAFPTRQPFQGAFCTLGAFLLHRSSNMSEFVSSILYLFSIPLVPIRCNCYVSTSKVNTDYLIGFNWLWGIICQLYVQVVQPISVLAQLSASRLSPFELAHLVVSDLQFDMLPTTVQSQTSTPIFLSKRKDSRIIVGAGWLKCFNWFAFLDSGLAISSKQRHKPE